jgi:Ca2+:H+ antiporter
MGRATEHLAEHLGQGVGGLLNATFGNAAELIIALFALSKGLTGVVKASITGSIIGNILLVLGLSFLSGGLKFRRQEFNRVAAGVSATALTLAAIALVIPTVFHQTAAAVPVAQGGWTPAKEQGLSLAIAVVLFLTYALTLVFSLVTHRELFGAEDGKDVAREAGEERTILFNLCGHGNFDLAAYDAYLAGELEDPEFSDAEMDAALARLPDAPAIA